jgi:hypothetical protein
VNNPPSIATTDFDGDGDLDVLSSSVSYDEKNVVAWYENTDGKGTFGNAQVIPVAAGWARSVAAADLDADGDMDFVSASLLVGRIVWHERRLLGDTNADGLFNSSDLVRAFQAPIVGWASRATVRFLAQKDRFVHASPIHRGSSNIFFPLLPNYLDSRPYTAGNFT